MNTMICLLTSLLLIIIIESKGNVFRETKDMTKEKGSLCDLFCPCDAPPSPSPKPNTPAIPKGGPYPSRIKIDTLPGLSSVEPYEYYSGFLNAGTPPSGRGTMYFHYICAMAPDWREKPMTIWYNVSTNKHSYVQWNHDMKFITIITGRSRCTVDLRTVSRVWTVSSHWRILKRRRRDARSDL